MYYGYVGGQWHTSVFVLACNILGLISVNDINKIHVMHNGRMVIFSLCATLEAIYTLNRTDIQSTCDGKIQDR